MPHEPAPREDRRPPGPPPGDGPPRRGLAALGKDHALYRALTENSLDVVTILDAGGGILFESPSVHRVLGFRPSELVGRSAFDFIHPDDAARIRDALAAVVAEPEQPLTATLRFRHGDGSWRHVEVIAQSRLADPAVRGVVVNVRDVTERLRVQEELGRSEARFRQLAESIRELVWIYTPDFSGVLYVSSAYERIFGQSVESLRADPTAFLRAVHPEDRPRLERAMARVREEPQALVYRILCPDGQVRWLEVTGYPMRGPTGEVEQVAGIIEDITRRKHDEEELRRAKEEAERADRAKSEFLSRMSHELRTPLHAILGFAQLLEVERPGDRESVQQILHAGNHLLELINEVLDIASIEAGRVPLSLEAVYLREVLDEALGLVRPLADHQQVTLPADAPQLAELYVHADRQRLKQVLLNLLSNAIKYNWPGGSVEVRCEAMAEGRLRISVVDTGPGIPPERLDEMFVPFGRLGAERTGTEGTGLGLVLSRLLVEAMGGELGVESTPGEGSRFHVYLAVAADQPARFERRAAAPAPTPPVPASAACRRTLLHVEDNVVNLRLIERVLEQRPGVEVIQAMQGRLALELALRHRPDLVLLDLHLPDLPGEQVLRALRARPETADIPVIVLSADAVASRADSLRSAGVREYLTKPVDVARLLHVLDRVLEETPR